MGRASTRITTVPLLSVQKKEILQDYSLAQQARKKSLSHNTDESGPLWREPRARAPRRGGHWEEDEKKYGQIEKKTENNDDCGALQDFSQPTKTAPYSFLFPRAHTNQHIRRDTAALFACERHLCTTPKACMRFRLSGVRPDRNH